MIVQISAGQGPPECQLAVAKLEHYTWDMLIVM